MNIKNIDSDKHTLLDFLKSDDPDLFAKAGTFTAFLDDWKNKGTYSYHRLVTSACCNTTTIRDESAGTDRPMIVLASNTYLGLNTRPEVVEAAKQALDRYGSGLCGSRFLSGTYDLVVELECKLAEFERREAAMVFTTGYQANVGTISALMRPGDLVVIDRLSHASIVDGCRLSNCELRTFRHNNVKHLAQVLERHASKSGGKFIVVEGVYSMDGDITPLPEIARLARKFGARLMVDEAHGTGVLGPTGRGTVEHFGVEKDVDLIVGTFSKVLGGTGGYIAGSREVIEYVRHYGRSYMFSASPVPSTIAAVLKALEILQNEPQLRDQLWKNVGYFYAGLKKLGFTVYPDPPESAILTIPIGGDETVRDMSKKLYESGLFVSLVAYPAVPPGQGKIRVSLSSSHTKDNLDTALEILGTVGKQFDIVWQRGRETHSELLAATA
jgi:glycine C-acetyltransferase